MSAIPALSRRALLTGGAGAAALALVGHGQHAHAAGPGASGAQADLDYTSPEAFEVAEQAYLDLGAQNNEAGLYAWGESYYLNGLLLMYQAHADESYLDRFEDRLDHILASTDKARGVSDYSGRSGPCWRAAGNYTAGHGELTLDDGSPGIQVRWAGATSSDATATVTRIEAGRFDLELNHPASTHTLTNLSLDPAAENYAVDAVSEVYATGARWTAIDHRPEHADADELAEGTVEFEPQFYAFAVHTGMMTLPMARYVRLVRSTPELSHRLGRAARTLSAVRHSVRHHRDDFQIDDDGIGDFRWPLGAPVPFDGTIQPLNQSHALGATFAELYAITGNQRYRTQVEALLKSLRLSLVEQDGAYQWRYWPVHGEMFQGFDAEDEISTYTPSYTPTTQFEDISHAAITLEFVQSVHESGIEDMSADRELFATTFIDYVIRGADSVWYRVDGTTDATASTAVQSARWLMLDDVEPAIHDQVVRVYEAEPLEPSQGSHALGIAYLNLTA
ncbi:MAG TPA: hypothetical protein VK095_07580 [Beutenbergiaceae bacterium]|nr:hypothetical protein [Beutenbergiaceae bacterium]